MVQQNGTQPSIIAEDFVGIINIRNARITDLELRISILGRENDTLKEQLKDSSKEKSDAKSR
jgi:hypothetical protein